MAARKKLTGKAALVKVLEDNGGGPMKVGDIITAALPLTSLAGKTPRQTLAARLYTSPEFTTAGRGMIKLAPAAKDAAKGKSTAARVG